MKTLNYPVILLTLLLCASCQKQEIPLGDEEIIIKLDEDLILTSETKTTALTSLPSTLYWCASTGVSGSSDTQKYAPAQGSVSSGKISTGKYQTATPTSYNWYLSNHVMSIAATGPTISVADNSTDLIAGVTKATDSATPSVTLGHIFARTGTLTFNTQSGYTVSNVSWKISRASSGTSGSYNMASNVWTPGTTAMSATAITSSSDMYLIPGTYTFTVSYSLTKGDYTDSFTRSGSAELVQGAVNAITASATGGNAQEIILSVSLAAWGSNSATVSTLS